MTWFQYDLQNFSILRFPRISATNTCAMLQLTGQRDNCRILELDLQNRAVGSNSRKGALIIFDLPLLDVLNIPKCENRD